MFDTPDHLTDLEATLAELAPASPIGGRDRLMYEAGRRSAPRGWAWPSAAMAFATLSGAFGLQLLQHTEPAPRIVERFTPVPVAAKPEAPEGHPQQPTVLVHHRESDWGNAFRSNGGYLSQRDRVIYFGTDALPPSPVVSDVSNSSKPSVEDLLN